MKPSGGNTLLAGDLPDTERKKNASQRQLSLNWSLVAVRQKEIKISVARTPKEGAEFVPSAGTSSCLCLSLYRAHLTVG